MKRKSSFASVGESAVHDHSASLLWISSRWRKWQSPTTHLMAMEQREVEEVARGLLFALEMGSPLLEDPRL